MIIIPREKPIIENLNSYYLDIRKFFEHYQGEFGSGGIYFNARSAEGIIFFDKDELLSGFFKDKNGEIKGKAAIDRIMEAVDEHNFSLNVYPIDPDKEPGRRNFAAFLADKLFILWGKKESRDLRNKKK